MKIYIVLDYEQQNYPICTFLMEKNAQEYVKNSPRLLYIISETRDTDEYMISCLTYKTPNDKSIKDEFSFKAQYEEDPKMPF